MPLALLLLIQLRSQALEAHEMTARLALSDVPGKKEVMVKELLLDSAVVDIASGRPEPVRSSFKWPRIIDCVDCPNFLRRFQASKALLFRYLGNRHQSLLLTTKTKCRGD